VAAFATVLAGLVILGLNTNRVMAGTTYDDVVAVPQEMGCLAGPGFRYHTIDAGGIRWYETNFLPPSDRERFGEFQQLSDGYARGRLHVLTGAGTASRPQEGSSRGADPAIWDVRGSANELRIQTS
jgi:hypothetical protein